MNILHFDQNIAKEVGANGAVLYQNIKYWIEKNIANETNFINGHYWTYNSMSAFEELFGYMTKRQIQTALNKLKESGYIEWENGLHNDIRNRTNYYRLGEKAMLENSKIEMLIINNIKKEAQETRTPILNKMDFINSLRESNSDKPLIENYNGKRIKISDKGYLYDTNTTDDLSKNEAMQVYNLLYSEYKKKLKKKLI